MTHPIIEAAAKIADEYAQRELNFMQREPHNSYAKTALRSAENIASSIRAMPIPSPWQSIESAPAWTDKPTKVWVLGGRFRQPTLIDSDGEYWRASDLDILPKLWAPLEIPALPESPPS